MGMIFHNFRQSCDGTTGSGNPSQAHLYPALTRNYPAASPVRTRQVTDVGGVVDALYRKTPVHADVSAVVLITTGPEQDQFGVSGALASSGLRGDPRVIGFDRVGGIDDVLLVLDVVAGLARQNPARVVSLCAVGTSSRERPAEGFHTVGVAAEYLHPGSAPVDSGRFDGARPGDPIGFVKSVMLGRR
ncbi:hypothetical protein KIH74_15215 [Kineosporia sp. J2-2]|uniref:Uncharacterized protein n=1 Tax=Kineosporia corallincola TaxID=2835133 RepID=A0ABS5TGX0_9ACTN|nr:hypothetical protein [Kineosporia corallincola]MBT0770290.1 hypothetical protein [Kineosporia corallincola]